MDETPKAPEIPEREKLQAAIAAEQQARSRAVMEQINKICEANNCKFIAKPSLVETPGGGWIIVANPGVMPL